jgi:hypothetical protein
MQPIAAALTAIRAVLLDDATIQNYPVKPPKMFGDAKIAVVYQSLSSGSDVASTDGKALYSPFLFQVVATTVAETVSDIVELGDAIRTALHFDADRRAQLPAGIRSMQVERDINFPEPSTAGGIRQNLGVIVRVIV